MRILIADDHLIFAQSLATLLANIEGFEVVGIVSNGKLALQKLANERVDIVLSDLQMPTMSGIELTLQIRQRFPAVKVMILSMVEDAVVIREAIQAGVVGFCSKNIDKEELERALHIVDNGETYLSHTILRELTRTLAQSSTNGGQQPEVSTLSEREIDVLRLITQEFNTYEIANQLFVSVNTVETHRKNLFRKLGVKNAIGLIKFALRHGLACL